MMDRDEFERKVAQWTPLVHRVAREKFGWAFTTRNRNSQTAGVDGDDLIQEGLIVLMDLIRQFDPDRNVDFGVYAWNTLHFAMLHHVQAQGVRIPTTTRPRQSAKRGSEDLQEKAASVQDCRAMSELYPHSHMESKLLMRSLRLDAEMGQQAIENQDFLAVCLAKLGGALTPEMLRAVEMRAYGATLKEIGAELGISYGTARQWLKKAEKLIQRRLWREAEDMKDG